MLKDRAKAAVREFRIAFPASTAHPVLNIGLRVGLTQRTQVIRRSNALPELFKCWVPEYCAELWLAQEETLQSRFSANDDIRKHSKLFKRL